MELLQAGRVLRPRGHKRGETAKMIIRIPMWQAVGHVLLSHTEGFHVTTLAVGVPYTGGKCYPGCESPVYFLSVGRTLWGHWCAQLDYGEWMHFPPKSSSESVLLCWTLGFWALDCAGYSAVHMSGAVNQCKETGFLIFVFILYLVGFLRHGFSL